MCGCGSTLNNTTTFRPYSAPVSTGSSIECDITKENLITWKNLLSCIKTNNYYTIANIPEFNVNKFLGVIQSALNYPSNYCYYYDQLNYFKTFVLINIINNVPQCINQ